MYIVQHYKSFNKDNIRGKSRILVLSEAGFDGTPYTLCSSNGSPIKQAKALAEKMTEQLGRRVHLVLLDGKNMDGSTGYMVFRKFI